MTTVCALTSLAEAVTYPAVVGRNRETETEAMFRAIRSGDRTGAERLYALLNEGIRFFLVRSLGAAAVSAVDVEDVFSVVLQAIQQGEFRDPEALAGFALGVVKSHVSLLRQEPSRPVATGIVAPKAENSDAMRRVLQETPERDREALVRVYVDGQDSALVMREMELTPAELRTIKSRAKARFAELATLARIPRKPVGSVRSGLAAVAVR